VIGPLGDRCENLERRAIGTVRLVPVAATGHTLAVAPRPIPRAMVREHLQLVLTDRTALTEGQDFGVFVLRTWRLGDLGAKRALCWPGWDGEICQRRWWPTTWQQDGWCASR
jgi:hypothetical protein